jgi:hypothetical protein
MIVKVRKDLYCLFIWAIVCASMDIPEPSIKGLCGIRPTFTVLIY